MTSYVHILLGNVTCKSSVVCVDIAHSLIIDFQLSKKGAIGLVSCIR